MDADLLAEQFAGITDYVGGAFGDFVFSPGDGEDDVTLRGPCTPLRRDDPRLAGSDDRLFVLTIPVAFVPADLRSGHELTNNGRRRRVVRVDHQPNGLSEIVLTA